MKYLTNIIFLILIISLTSCSKKTQNVGSSNELDKIYPHTKEFKSTNMHGLTYYTNKGICEQCHKQLEGVFTKDKDLSCKRCHENFPHTEEFKTSGMHSTGYFEDKTSCKLCHGKDYSGGNAKISCKKCHNFPHDPDWKLPKNHGAAYLAKSEEPVKCKTCHIKQGPVKVSCTQCHKSFPHTEEFKTTGIHAKGYFEDQTSCTSCHGEDYLGGSVKISCKKCHSAYPHDPLWALPKNHGAAYIATSNDSVKCTTCHSKKGSLAKNYQEQFVACDACHIEMPHPSPFDGKTHSSVAKTYRGKCTICHSYNKKDNNTRFLSNKAGCKLSECHDKYEQNTPRIEFPLQ